MLTASAVGGAPRESQALLSPAPSPGSIATQRDPANGELSFHEGTERRLLDAVRAAVARAEAQMGVEEAGARAPEIVMQAADDFCWRQHWMMLVGDVKGAILDEAVRDRVGAYSAEPDGEFAAIEFGTYVGYSAVRIARLLPREGRLYSVDPNPEVQVVASEVVALAGLRERVKFISRTAQAATEELARVGQKSDLVFIDHDKRDYLASLLRLEKAGMMKPGCTVVADNVEVFKLQDYLTHVRTCGRYRSRNFQSSLEYTPPLEYQPVDTSGRPLGKYIADAVEVSVYAPP